VYIYTTRMVHSVYIHYTYGTQYTLHVWYTVYIYTTRMVHSIHYTYGTQYTLHVWYTVYIYTTRMVHSCKCQVQPELCDLCD
jgi:hypothetical protein